MLKNAACSAIDFTTYHLNVFLKMFHYHDCVQKVKVKCIPTQRAFYFLYHAFHVEGQEHKEKEINNIGRLYFFILASDPHGMPKLIMYCENSAVEIEVLFSSRKYVLKLRLLPLF